MIKAISQALRFKARSRNDPILATQPVKRWQGWELEDRIQAPQRIVSKMGCGCTERDVGQIQG